MWCVRPCGRLRGVEAYCIVGTCHRPLHDLAIDHAGPAVAGRPAAGDGWRPRIRSSRHTRDHPSPVGPFRDPPDGPATARMIVWHGCSELWCDTVRIDRQWVIRKPRADGDRACDPRCPRSVARPSQRGLPCLRLRKRRRDRGRNPALRVRQVSQTAPLIIRASGAGTVGRLMREGRAQPTGHSLNHRVLSPAVEVIAIGDDFHLARSAGPRLKCLCRIGVRAFLVAAQE